MAAGGAATGATSLPERGPWSVRLLVGAVTALNDDSGGLLRRPNPVGNLLVGFEDATGLELTSAYHFTESVWLRFGYHTFEVDFGTDFFTEDPTGPAPFETVQFGTARHHMLKAGGFWGERKRFSEYGLGLVVGVPRYSDLRVSPEGAARVGIAGITAGSGLLYGIEGELAWRLGRSGLLLGFGASYMGGDEAGLRIETTASSSFQSGTAGIKPATFAVFVEYRLP